MTLSIAALLVAITLWIVVVGCGIAAALNSLNIVDLVNSLLPENERFDPLIWHSLKYERLHSEYRRLFPTGKLLQRQKKLGVCMLACGLVAVLILFFSRNNP